MAAKTQRIKGSPLTEKIQCNFSKAEKREFSSIADTKKLKPATLLRKIALRYMAYYKSLDSKW